MDDSAQAQQNTGRTLKRALTGFMIEIAMCGVGGTESTSVLWGVLVFVFLFVELVTPLANSKHPHLVFIAQAFESGSATGANKISVAVMLYRADKEFGSEECLAGQTESDIFHPVDGLELGISELFGGKLQQLARVAVAVMVVPLHAVMFPLLCFCICHYVSLPINTMYLQYQMILNNIRDVK